MWEVGFSCFLGFFFHCQSTVSHHSPLGGGNTSPSWLPTTSKTKEEEEQVRRVIL